MTTAEKTMITVKATIHASVEKVWALWTAPKHIVKWNNASDDWHTPRATNDLRQDGKFMSRMEARDGSMGFDFEGTYYEVKKHEQISYTISDGRKVSIVFERNDKATQIAETFEAEQMNPTDMQRDGWQAILNNFKKYVEESPNMEKTKFEISIHASAEKVYSTTIGEGTYAAWTAEFNPTSRFEGSWEKGSKILFLGTDQEGKIGGMVARIKENIPNKFISIEHYGVIGNGKEITSGPEVEGWAGALENYSFTQRRNTTVMTVEVDTNYEYMDYFSDTWPKALNKLKSICEA
ncbi:MAG: SRPBCC domain-containing protein [Cyclobacteriaceae bacterium]|nr:SRPBCC domain-containing protein [Cyclobacteriaceae bacterium]